MKTIKTEYSSSAYVDGKLIGKFIEIEQMPDGSFDLWLTKPDRKPIGTRKLNNLIRSVGIPFTVVNGEAWSSTRNLDIVRKAASTCEIKRKRRVSEATREKCRKHLAKMRKESASS